MKTRAFTILELIVAMAIIAVLVALSFITIQTVQRAQRDTERRAAANAIKNEIEAYYGDFGIYPASISFANVAGTPRTTTVTIGVAPYVRTLTLKSAAQIAIKASDPATVVTGATGPFYCYLSSTGGYALSVYLEDESGFSTARAQYGNSNTSCPPANVLRSINSN